MGGEKKASFLEAMFIRITGILYLFFVLVVKMLQLKPDINMFTERRRKNGMSGMFHVNSIPGQLDVDRVKALSKANKVTINDVVLTAFMKTMQGCMWDTEAAKPVD